jgi:Mg/Co/Ni transporter MgtE
MSKITNIIRAKVVECFPSEEKDKAKGIGFVVILESEKQLTKTLTVPVFEKVKSIIELKPNQAEQLFEVEYFNIPDGKTVKSYIRIIKKFENKV